MQPQPTPGGLVPSSSGVLVVDGYGVRLCVEHGRLVVADGIGRVRRLAQFPRAGSRIRRLVVLGHTGSITFDALRWLADVGIRFVHLDPDGRLLAASGEYGRDDPRLRRAQALAIDTPTGDDIARRLIGEKVAGQAETLALLSSVVSFGDETVEAMRQAAGRVHVATNRDEVRLAEAQAAAAYWAAWAPVAVRFPTRELDRVPDAWRTIGTRSSDITGNPRLATNPANAILNYLYAILEAEARLACLAIGLDPGLGVLHADLKARDSLALDVMEAVRPAVDRYVLDLLGAQVFRRGDFVETKQGGCRILAPLSHHLAQTGPTWGRQLGPVVERVARLFAEGPGSRVSVTPTTLTGSNRSAGRPPGGPRLGSGKRSAEPRKPPWGLCVECGRDAPVAGRKYCNACLPAAVHAQRTAFASAGNAKLSQLRELGHKPGIGGDAGRARGAKVASARLANQAWESDHADTPDPATFHLSAGPAISHLTVRELMAATGFSRQYANAILKGKRVPHPRWWARLELLGTEGATPLGATRHERSSAERGRRPQP